MSEGSIAPSGFSVIETNHRMLDVEILQRHKESHGQDPFLPELKRQKLKLKDKIEGRKNN